MTQWLISSDLDGTLIDHHNYSFAEALPALQHCESLGIPVILNTSKTYQEARTIQGKLSLKAPIIVENGSALFFHEDEPNKPTQHKVFGQPRSEALRFIEHIRASHPWQFEGFNDWSVNEIAQQTGLSLPEAEQANSKQFSEPFLWHDQESSLSEFIAIAKQHQLKVLKGGRFFHLQGDTDKAQPLHWLIKNYQQVFERNDDENGHNNDHNDNAQEHAQTPPTLICLGDNHNDIAMLNIADIPVCIRSPVADYPTLATQQKIIYTQGYGPIGWSEAIFSILKQ